MTSKKWFVIFNVIFVFLVSEINAKDNDGCKCNFDSPSYIAECDCGLSCSIAMKDDRECYITCDGKVKNISRGYAKIFGEPAGYKEQLDSYIDLLSKEGIKAFQKRESPEKAIMYLFRSAYIGVSFIPEDMKINVDQFVHDSFTQNWSHILPAFFNNSAGEFNKTFRYGELLRVSFKLINLKIGEYIIRFRIL
jgi:hypothetical protein